MSSPTFAIVAGGGTGGHVVPAVAIGQALVAAGHPPESVRFVGSARGIERRLVPEAGFPLTLLPGRGIVRRMAVANLAAVAGLVAAIGRAVVLVGRLRPAVVVSVGGYASVACVVAAVVWRRPLVVAEQNAVPGAANRLAARFARACAVSFPGTPLPRATLTGNPVRASVLAVERTPAARAAARRQLGLPLDGPVVAVVTGSLGARRVNRAVVELMARWSRDGRAAGVAVRHVIGERDWEQLSGRERTDPPVYQQVRFEDRMDLVYAAADVLVGRAGASTVAELAVVGLASVLVPLPGAPGDHQTHNARRMEAAGAAVVVPDADCDAARLDEVLAPLLADPDRLGEMGRVARIVGRPGAAAAVAELAERVARGQDAAVVDQESHRV